MSTQKFGFASQSQMQGATGNNYMAASSSLKTKLGSLEVSNKHIGKKPLRTSSPSYWRSVFLLWAIAFENRPFFHYRYNFDLTCL